MPDTCTYTAGLPCTERATHAVQMHWHTPGVWNTIHLAFPPGRLVMEFCEDHAKTVARQRMQQWEEMKKRREERKIESNEVA